MNTTKASNAKAPTCGRQAAPAALAQFDDLPNAAFVRLPTVMGMTGASSPTVWRWSKSGRLPAPVKLGPNVTAWRVGDLRAALANRVADAAQVRL